MLLSGTILACMLSLLPAANSFYSIFTDSPFYGFDSFPNSDISSNIRKSRYREYEPSPPSYYATSGYYHHGPTYHQPHRSHHGPPPPSYHGRPHTYTYEPPPPFTKPSYRNPHHYQSQPSGPPHNYDSSENYSYGSWGSHEYDDSIFEHSPKPKGKGANCNSPTRRPSYETGTRPPSGSQLPFPPTLNQHSKPPAFTPTFPPLKHPFHSVSTSSSGTIIPGPPGLISGNINQNNFQQSTLQNPKENSFSSSGAPDSQPTGRPATDVSSLIAGVFPGSGTQSGPTTSYLPSAPGRDDNALIAGVFPSLNTQGNQPQQFNRPTTTGSNTGNLFGGIFTNPTAPDNRPPIQSIPPSSGANTDELIAGVFANPNDQSSQPPQQNTPTSFGSNVDGIIAGVFPSLAQGQQNNIANSSPTAPPNNNVLLSGTVQRLPNFGERIPPPSATPYPFRPTQSNGDKIPVFQYSFPSPSVHQQPFTPTSTSSTNNTSQNVPVFQPGQESSTPDTTSDGGNGDNAAQNGNEEDSTAFDIDIRLGQIGEEVTPSNSQRNRAKAA